MKTIKYLTAFALATVLLGSCEARYNNGNNGMPPGQAKKIYGGSSKDYAPGQRKKKRYNTTILFNP
ncbi:quinol oxidase subunit 4 [Elizabethkingia anophelis]|nr:quinol oxidase subunit 4 [Elizabethkingia anophelis]